MILKKLAFKNFKSFGEDLANQTFNDLDILTLIYGENNSGKSNILKFIDLIFKQKIAQGASYLVEGQNIRKPNEPSPFWKGKIVNNAFLFHNNIRSNDITFEIQLGINAHEIVKLEKSEIFIKDLSIERQNFNLKIIGKINGLPDPYESEIILESALVNDKEIYFYQGGIPTRFFRDTSGTLLKGDSITFENLLGLLNDSILFIDHNRFISQEDRDNNVKALNPNNFKNWLHNMSLDPVEYEKYEKYLNFIRATTANISTDALRNFEPTFSIRENQLDVFLKSNSKRLPINSFGTGIMQILLILSMIFETNSRVVLIEELELNLSPKAQQELLKILTNLLVSNKIDQVIFSSHSGILTKSTDLSVYEIKMLETGISQITYLTTPSKVFFVTSSKDWNEIARVVRESGVKGPEWE